MLRLAMKAGLYTSIFVVLDTHLLASINVWVYYFFVFPLLGWLILYYKSIPAYLMVIASLFFLIGIYNVIRGDNTILLLTKVTFSIFFLFLFYFYYIKYLNYNTIAAFSFYMNCAVFTSFFLFLQLLFHKIGFKAGYDFRYLGLNSYYQDKDVGFIPLAFGSEPAQVAISLLPSLFVAIHNLLMRRKVFIGYLSSILIILAIIICSSSSGFIGLFFSFVVIAINYRAFTTLILVSILGLAGFFLLYTTNPKFSLRFEDSNEVFVKKNVTLKNINDYNYSTLVLYHHFVVATENFKQHPLLGTGLGSHPIAVKKISTFDIEKFPWADLNKEDACSLLLRLMSETGVLGIVLFLFFLARFAVNKTSSVVAENWIISQAVYVLMIPVLLRGGNYLGAGLPFFLLLYYYVNRSNKSWSATAG